MTTVGTFQAKTHLTQLLGRVARGESILITNRGLPVPMLVPTVHQDAAELADLGGRANRGASLVEHDLARPHSGSLGLRRCVSGTSGSGVVAARHTRRQTQGRGESTRHSPVQTVILPRNFDLPCPTRFTIIL